MKWRVQSSLLKPKGAWPWDFSEPETVDDEYELRVILISERKRLFTADRMRLLSLLQPTALSGQYRFN